MQGLAFWRETGTSHSLIRSNVAKVCSLGMPWETLTIPIVSDSQREGPAVVEAGAPANLPIVIAAQSKPAIQVA